MQQPPDPTAQDTGVQNANTPTPDTPQTNARNSASSSATRPAQTRPARMNHSRPAAHAPTETHVVTRALAAKQQLFFDRELSWLDFNARVLAEAVNPAHPLLERLKFLAIYSSNLDEFFMIHVPGMRERADEDTGRAPSTRGVARRLQAIQQKLASQLTMQYQCLLDLLPRLAEHGVRLVEYQTLTEPEKQRLELFFESEIFPVLTPLAVDPGHPFPYMSNLSLSLAVVVHDPRTGRDHFARVKVPTKPALPRLVPVAGDPWKFVLLEEVITAHIGRLFAGMQVRACYPFRLTRNADLELQEDAANDLLEMIEEELAKRRFGEVERLELSHAMPDDIRKTLMSELGVTEDEVYSINGMLHMGDLMPLTSLDVSGLRDKPFVPAIPPPLRGASDIFAVIRKQDVLLHHPYQAFGCVIDFIRAAAADPNVLAIKHTLYRTSGDSPILAALIDAADAGKQVACLVELKARFDEQNNITWAKQLEKAGVHVVYGLLGLKTHCKVTLVVRREEEGLRRYLHVGTGNYNPRTAGIYTDVGILTCAPNLGMDATDLFNFLTGYARQEQYRAFLVAPITLRPRLTELIEREAEKHTPDNPGRIVAKMNALTDQSLIKALYAASQMGVQIDLIIRGMCCLRPGVPDLSENIRVMSVVGRFLEHSRLFHFRNGGDDEIYIGSADWMARNLDRRVEVVIPVISPDIRRALRDDVLRVLLEDNQQSWDLDAEGIYTRRRVLPGQRRRSAQNTLLESLTK